MRLNNKRSSDAVKTGSLPSKRCKIAESDSNHNGGPCLTARVSRLESLPGELRNHIYDIIVAEGVGPYTLVYHPEFISAFAERHKSRPYLGLIQVNRQLRTEFNPLYRARPTIHLQDVKEYLRMFPPHTPHGSDSIANLLDLLEKLANVDMRTSSPGIDILPLLQLDLENLPFKLADPHSKCDRHTTLLDIISCILTHLTPQNRKTLLTIAETATVKSPQDLLMYPKRKLYFIAIRASLSFWRTGTHGPRGILEEIANTCPMVKPANIRSRIGFSKTTTRGGIVRLMFENGIWATEMQCAKVKGKGYVEAGGDGA
ncbi:hypothetical protein BKA63DRAFT_138756 [Paraphoma chrysanthemicola]|nr:hypothetical protein BKA63DRAFT_138756 [Paraphoma chrysanthemicola]